jgi:tripartite-type tricarboxylate transporter receptor subunit TctC
MRIAMSQKFQGLRVARRFQGCRVKGLKGFFLLTLYPLIPLTLNPTALAQEPFYQGKTITFIAGTEPGGTLDMRTKALTPFLRKYIPGEPTISTEYMPGAGGRKAANYLSRVARPDGLTIGVPVSGFLMLAVLKQPGVEYDINKLIYLGAPDGVAHYVFSTRKEAGLSSVERLRAVTGVRIGGQAVGHTIYMVGRLFGYILGLKEPKFVTGYSGPEIDLALLRGEVDARPNLAETILRRNPEFLERGLVDFHAILEAPLGKKHLRFVYLPEIGTFARSQRARSVLDVFRASRTIGGAYLLPPGTPKERVDILREAVRKSFKDPGYQKEYKRLVGDDLAPVMAEEIEKAIKALQPDPEIIELYKKIAGPGPLPPQ